MESKRSRVPLGLKCAVSVGAVMALLMGAGAIGKCPWDVVTVEYWGRDCSNTNAYCTYYEYEPSWPACVPNADGKGQYSNCITTNQATPYQQVTRGTCNGTNCSGGSVNGSWGTNNNDVKYKADWCGSGT